MDASTHVNSDIYSDADRIPDWVIKIAESRKLDHEELSVFGINIHLLSDVAIDLVEISREALSQAAFTPDTLCRIESCVGMIAEVVKIARLCPREARPDWETDENDVDPMERPAKAPFQHL